MCALNLLYMHVLFKSSSWVHLTVHILFILFIGKGKRKIREGSKEGPSQAGN